MKPESIVLDKKELQAFILLYVANADLGIEAEELEFIVKILDEEKLIKVMKLFNKLNDSECLEVILSHKEVFFSNDNDREELLQEINELIRSDEKIRKMEVAALHGLQRLLK